MDKINLRQKLSLFTDQWKPKIVGEVWAAGKTGELRVWAAGE
jgi:hypothetical protein